MSTDLEKLSLKLYTSNDPDTDGPNREYQIYPITGDVEISSRKDAFSIAPPGLPATDNILLGVSGMEADITIPFQLWDSGDDRSDGTNTTSVVTVQEQATYLEDVMHAPTFTAQWQLDHLTGSAFNDDDVFLEEVDFSVISDSNRKWKPATLRLRRGGSVG